MSISGLNIFQRFALHSQYPLVCWPRRPRSLSDSLCVCLLPHLGPASHLVFSSPCSHLLDCFCLGIFSFAVFSIFGKFTHLFSCLVLSCVGPNKEVISKKPSFNIPCENTSVFPLKHLIVTTIFPTGTKLHGNRPCLFHLPQTIPKHYQIWHWVGIKYTFFFFHSPVSEWIKIENYSSVLRHGLMMFHWKFFLLRVTLWLY